VMMASDRAKRLVEQILVFGRKDSSKKTVVAIRPLIQEALELLKATIPSSVFIKAELQEDAKQVFADPTRIHEALINLATNAVHAMQRKGVLQIRYHTTTLAKQVQGKIGVLPPGEYCVIEVEDTGVGMDATTLARAFDPFFTTKPVGEGTGMGLSVVVGVVQSHGGDIQVRTEVGRGSIFTMYLPVTAEQAQPPVESRASLPGRGTEYVLFVDDEQLLVDLMCAVLEKLGYRVMGTTKASEALAYVKDAQGKVDILVTDQTMPGMTGLELAKAVLVESPELPVILCTGYSLDVTPARLEKIGIRRLVMKPFRPNDLALEIQSVLHNGKEK